MIRHRNLVLAGLFAVTGILPSAWATIPYGKAGGPFPGFGPGLIEPPAVGGKEFSHDRDYEVLLGGPPDIGADPEQVVAWDGTIGASGVTNLIDYSGTRPSFDDDSQIDALANRRDFAYQQLKSEEAHLIFSLDDLYHEVIPFAAPGASVMPAMLPPGMPGVSLGNGNTVGGSGEVSYELGTIGGNPPEAQGLWAAQADVNGMPLTDDVDGLEVWGPEPPDGDADKYSLDIDALSGGIPGGAVSVWNGAGSSYISHSAIVMAVEGLLGAVPATAFLPGPTDPLERGPAAINLDALMVQDVVSSDLEFEAAPTGGPGDEIIFSIRQIVDPEDADGFYATGSELFVLNGDGSFMFLKHGDHEWSHDYALEVFGGSQADELVFAYDINAIEAVGEFSVPEPASMTLLLMALTAVSCWRRGGRQAGRIG